MNKTELVTRLATASGLSKADARRVIEALFDPDKGIIVEALSSGDSVRIPAFGTFNIKRRAARQGRNPRTGEQIRIPQSLSVKFQASKGLKDAAGAGRPPAARRKARLEDVVRRPKRKAKRNGGGGGGGVGGVPRPKPPAAGAEPAEELLLGGGAPGDVRFTAYHPKEIKPLTWCTLLAYAHLPDALTDVQEDSRARLGPDADDYGRGKGEATTVIKRGADIVVVPELPGCRSNPKRGSFTWLKDWHRAEFELQATPEVPGYTEGEAVNGRVAFYVGPLLVGEVKIWAYISEDADASQADRPSESVTGEAYRKIFVSYAHQDAMIVDALERAYKSLGDTYLRDVKTLRSGEKWNPALLRMIEQADIFQLCWSKAAKRSKYVKQEWQHALEQKRRDPFIRPTYWEEPMPEPPAKLKKLHFAFYEVA